MTVLVNGDPVELPEGSGLAELLTLVGKGDPSAPIAVAVNLDIVRRQDREAHPLRDGDRVDIVTAVGGG